MAEPYSIVQAEIAANSMTHGATSDLILSTVTEEIAEVLFREAPWVLDLDMVAIDQYCRVEARIRLLTAYMDEIIDTKGISKVPPWIFSEITRAEVNAYRRADSLGLSPEGRMKIAKDTGMAAHFASNKVSDLKGQGRALREAG